LLRHKGLLTARRPAFMEPRFTYRFHNDGRGHPDHFNSSSFYELFVLGARLGRDKRWYPATKVPVCGKVGSTPNRFFILRIFRPS
jgi:hypothetical protein